jgi:hypothetical protein
MPRAKSSNKPAAEKQARSRTKAEWDAYREKRIEDFRNSKSGDTKASSRYIVTEGVPWVSGWEIRSSCNDRVIRFLLAWPHSLSLNDTCRRIGETAINVGDRSIGFRFLVDVLGKNELFKKIVKHEVNYDYKELASIIMSSEASKLVLEHWDDIRGEDKKKSEKALEWMWKNAPKSLPMGKRKSVADQEEENLSPETMDPSKLEVGFNYGKPRRVSHPLKPVNDPVTGHYTGDTVERNGTEDA